MSELKTCFKRVDYDLDGLLHYIDIGDIGLPDIQRPFVWSNAKVRDLLDSMYRGFPVGYLLFWENQTVAGAKQIGTADKAHKVPARLIVDGQQRLTSLYAVFRGRKVLDEDYKDRQIEIAFRPRDGKFEVADAAIRRDVDQARFRVTEIGLRHVHHRRRPRTTLYQVDAGAWIRVPAWRRHISWQPHTGTRQVRGCASNALSCPEWPVGSSPDQPINGQLRRPIDRNSSDQACWVVTTKGEHGFRDDFDASLAKPKAIDCLE